MATELAKPSKVDQPVSFFRNQKTFKYAEIPLDYRYAERYDGFLSGVPRASYYRLGPETVGKPITVRVLSSLRRSFDFDVEQATNRLDVKYSQEHLQQAKESVSEGNWSAAVTHAAEAYTTGGSKSALAVYDLLEDFAEAVLSYKDFAPATGRNYLQRDLGPVTIPASITLVDELRFYRRQLDKALQK